MNLCVLCDRRHMVHSHLRVAFVGLMGTKWCRNVELDTIISLVEYLLSEEACNLIECHIDTYTIAIYLIESTILDRSDHYALESFNPCT